MIVTQPSVTRASARPLKMWVGYIFALAFLVAEIAEVIADPDGGVTLLDQVIVLGGWLYWLFCVRQLHEILANATNGSYPITPGKAFGHHFIPFYNFYWVVKWPYEMAKFVNHRSPSQRMSKWAGLFVLASILLRLLVDGALGLAVMFSVGIYLSRRLARALAVNSDGSAIPADGAVSDTA
jgi:hypothetical protein